MERLTDRKTAADLKHNYERLRAAGMPRDIGAERYIKLAEYEDKEELTKPILYLCDPNKRSKCNNSPWCFENGGECRLTQYKEYAMTNENGKAIMKEGGLIVVVKIIRSSN